MTRYELDLLRYNLKIKQIDCDIFLKELDSDKLKSDLKKVEIEIEMLKARKDLYIKERNSINDKIKK